MADVVQQRKTHRPLVLCAALGVLGAGGLAWLRRPAPAPARVDQPLPGRPRLVAVVGGSMPHGTPGQPHEIELHEGRQTLGRDRDADVHLADLTISPRHAVVEADHAGRVVVRDLGTRNGLVVDGVPVAQAELHDGNRLQLGDVQLVYRVDPERDDGGRHGGELGENIGS